VVLSISISCLVVFCFSPLAFSLSLSSLFLTHCFVGCRRRVRDKDAVGEMKRKYLGTELVADLPPEFLTFMQHLQSLDYADRPDYKVGCVSGTVPTPDRHAHAGACTHTRTHTFFLFLALSPCLALSLALFLCLRTVCTLVSCCSHRMRVCVCVCVVLPSLCVQMLWSLLQGLYHKLGGDESTPFDWERVPYMTKNRQRPLPSLLDLCFLKLASNIERFPDLKIPYSIKKRMLDFLIRIHDGKLPRTLLDRLLDRNLQELDLSPCVFSAEDYHYVATRCTRLRSLTLGLTTDAIIKVGVCVCVCVCVLSRSIVDNGCYGRCCCCYFARRLPCEHA
jgi:hypothetical protein